MRAARVDANHSQIVKALRAIGASVADTSAVGKGFPDLVVKFRGSLWLMECKDGAKPPSKRKLTPAQEKFVAEWQDVVYVVKSPAEAVAALGVSTWVTE
jgi:hypothetical protein